MVLPAEEIKLKSLNWSDADIEDFVKKVENNEKFLDKFDNLETKTDDFCKEVKDSDVFRNRAIDNPDYIRAFKEYDPNVVYSINGNRPRSSGGGTITTPGGNVVIDGNGFPDFKPYVLDNPAGGKYAFKMDVKGNRTTDFTNADRLAGFTSSNPRPSDYVWHHHQDGQTMMLVRRDVHDTNLDGVAHTGGVAVIGHNKNNTSNTLYFPSPY